MARNRGAARGHIKKPATSGPDAPFLPRWVFAYLLYPGLLVAMLVVTCIRPIADPDCWFHLAFGRYVLQHGALPAGDIFSYTAVGREWISSGWGASVLMQFLFHRFEAVQNGEGALVWMVFVAAASGYLLIYFAAVRRYASGEVIVLPLMAAILCSYMRFLPRPDVWSQFFMACVIVLLVTSGDSPSKSPKRLWLLPPIFVLWANSHAGFLAGLIAVGIFSAWKANEWRKTRDRALAISLIPCALSFLVWTLNPYGFRYLALASKIRGIPGVKRLIFEWMPLVYLPGYNMPWPVYAGALALVAFVCAALIWRRERVPWWHGVTIIVFAGLALFQRRQVALAGLVLPAIIAPHLSGITMKLGRNRAVIPAITVAFALFFGTVQYKGILENGPGLPETGRNCRMVPCMAVEFLTQNPPPSRIYNSYGLGGYLLYFLSPEMPVFIDGRLDLYPHQVWEDYLATDENRMSVKDTCAKYGISTFVINIHDAFGDPEHLASRLAASPDWKLIYFDDDAGIFTRDEKYAATREFKYASPFTPDALLKALANPQTSAAATGELRRALEVSDHSANANALAALAAIRSGDSDSARKFLVDAMVRDPKSWLSGEVAKQLPRGR